MGRYLDLWSDWAYGGVDGSIEGNGGPACAAFLSPSQRLLETLFMFLISALEIWFGWKLVSSSGCLTKPLPPTERVDRTGKRFILVLLCMTFGIEVGFKFATKQLIYLLNPCHIATAIQIYLLASPPSTKVMVVFRVHMHLLNGATLAILFPVTNTRLLPFEVEIYWIQHILLLLIPFYLMRLGGPYTCELLSDLNWVLLSCGLAFAYHFGPLQALALITQVNLNNMLCPAVSDPFYGSYYRVWAMLHQRMLLLVNGKALTLLAILILPRTSNTYITQLQLASSSSPSSQNHSQPNTVPTYCPHCGSNTPNKPINGLNTSLQNRNGYSLKDE